MAIYKTITLNGTEQEIKIGGRNCDIRNDTFDTIYAACTSHIAAGKNGVLSIPAGHAVKLLDSSGTLYLLGNGTVQLCGNDYLELVFKCAPTGGGGGTVDAEARNSINALTLTVSELQTDVNDVKNTVGSVSNPNLADNPDFSINQRGLTEYTGGSETGASKVRIFDRWFSWMMSGKSVTINDGYVTLHGNKALSNATMDIRQWNTNINTLKGKKLIFSVCYRTSEEVNNRIFIRKVDANGVGTEISYSSFSVSEDWTIKSITAILPEDAVNLEYGVWGTDVDIKWAKLELGSVATPFTPPDTATELMKCQRYYQIHTTGDIDPIDLRPSMCDVPVVRQLSDGKYAYSVDI